MIKYFDFLKTEKLLIAGLAQKKLTNTTATIPLGLSNAMGLSVQKESDISVK